ncbi:MAG TPA: thiamine pyrophosphate-dependent enzyme [Burkholderiales bacterium]|nr:thiamine pyrophosphate-dependent enzyme [Burkholderiales bacterium]
MNDPKHIPAARSAATTSGRDAFLSLLASEGVDVMFGNPGTTELAIMEALSKQSQIEYVLGLQESIVVAMADGYARASGRLAACNVHVAPGLGNAMGSLYNAKFYGSPVLLTAGQQEQGHGLMEPLLYAPLLPIAQPMVKWATEVNRVEDLPRIVRRAAKVALTPPTGPVFISLPGDILDGEAELDMGHPSRVEADTRPSDQGLQRLAHAFLSARNPAIIAGHELATRHALDEAGELAEVLGTAVWQQTVPYSAQFRSEHPAFLGALTRNQQQVRDALASYDLLIFLGSDQLRMSVYSPVDAMPPGARIVQIGERDWELAKNYPVEIAIKANVKETLRALLPLLRHRMTPHEQAQAQRRLQEIAHSNWSAKRERAHQDATKLEYVRPMDPRVLMMRISEALPRDVVVLEEALVSGFSLLNFLPLRDPQGFYGLASGGIGFAMGGAIGISLALRDRPVVAIVGDGSAMYSVQALWTAAHMKLPITYVIPNNRGYRILKERLKSMRGTERFIGMDIRAPELNFVALAQSMGVPAQRVVDPADVGPMLQKAMSSGGPSLLDVSVADGFGG